MRRSVGEGALDLLWLRWHLVEVKEAFRYQFDGVGEYFVWS
jgi:hypothetical protein